MPRPIHILLILTSTLFLGAECGRPEVACIDWSGRTLEMDVYDWEDCSTFNARVCSNLTLPDRFVLRILDEPVQLRDLQCEMYRAELVEGDFPDLEFLGPADATLVYSSDFALAESVRIRGTDCYGRFFIAGARLGETERSNPNYWLAPGAGATTWAAGYRFIPNDPEACAEVQTDCYHECDAEVRGLE